MILYQFTPTLGYFSPHPSRYDFINTINHYWTNKPLDFKTYWQPHWTSHLATTRLVVMHLVIDVLMTHILRYFTQLSCQLESSTTQNPSYSHFRDLNNLFQLLSELIIVPTNQHDIFQCALLSFTHFSENLLEGHSNYDFHNVC